MAKCSIVPPVPVEQDVQLILTMEKARFLLELTGSVVGAGPGVSLAGVVWGALHGAGVEPRPERYFGGKTFRAGEEG